MPLREGFEQRVRAEAQRRWAAMRPQMVLAETDRPKGGQSLPLRLTLEAPSVWMDRGGFLVPDVFTLTPP